MNTHRGSNRYSSILSFRYLIWVDGPGHAPAALPREIPDAYCIEGWVGRRNDLGGCGISCPLLEFDPRTAQHAASRYTDWAVSTLEITLKKEKNRKTKVDFSGVANVESPRLFIEMFC
jgi:hypothetical protein